MIGSENRNPDGPGVSQSEEQDVYEFPGLSDDDNPINLIGLLTRLIFLSMFSRERKEIFVYSANLFDMK